MNVKNFVISGIAGGFIEFILGWLFYGILFKDSFPSNGTENMLLIFLGCMTFGFLLSYIFIKWAHISNWKTGLSSGAIIGLFIALYFSFFANSMKTMDELNIQLMALDTAITVVMSAIVGSTIALVSGKIK
ncbi:hypothetical protein [Flavobacterium sp. 123]|jgi:hypothetical protein|uniref:hypothetical protein n=1 Tax=Flavobacterium sp. 123 TaxID=2135627 RepID=UPI000EAC690B|nr:hypothetical protein [Flavobacterium sp. 123]RKT00345.1 hypothetical protein C8C88_2171 [Flavobacterium sp. 123]